MRRTILTLAALAIATHACSKSDEHAGDPVSAPPPRPEDFQKARADPALTPTPVSADAIFATRCATCHGPGGKGDGPAAAALNPKPRNDTDPTWQESVRRADHEHHRRRRRTRWKSPLMAPNPDLAGQEAILDGLVKIIRGFAPS